MAPKKKEDYNRITYLYLDQFAVSNLSQGSEDWINIRQLINIGYQSGKIVCPISFEHLMETSGRTLDEAILHHNYFKSISGGLIFKADEMISAQLLMSKIRKYNNTINTFLSSKMNPTFSFEHHFESLQKARKKYYEVTSHQYSFHNETVEMQKNKRYDESIQLGFFSVIKSLHVSEFVSILTHLYNFGRILIPKKNPTYYSTIVEILISKNKIKKIELKKLIDFLDADGIENISTLDTRISLSAYSASISKKFSPNDSIDISRISSAIQLSDIMLIDKEKKKQLLHLKLDKKYNTKILCGAKTDLRELEKLMESIVSQ